MATATTDDTTLGAQLSALKGVTRKTIEAALTDTELVVDPFGVEPSAEQAQRLAEPKRGLAGKALTIWVLTGESITAQAARGRARGATITTSTTAAKPQRRTAAKRKTGATARPEYSDEARSLAKRAGEIADAKGNVLKTKPGPAQIVRVIDYLAEKKVNGLTDPAAIPKLVGLSESKLRAYAQATDSAPEKDQIKTLRAVSKDIGDHLIWGRKFGAVLIALVEHAKEGAKE